MHGNLHGLTMAAGQPAPKKDTKYIEALFEKRIEYVKQLRSALEEPTSVASQTVAAYTDLLDELLTDIAVEAHRSVNTGQVTRAVAPILANGNSHAPPPPEKPGKGPPVDVFGQSLAHVPREEVTCVHCGRRIAASRFAPHLEKCLGKGRNASRHASRRASNA